MPTAGSARAVFTSSRIFLISGGELIERSYEHIHLLLMSFPLSVPVFWFVPGVYKDRSAVDFFVKREYQDFKGYFLLFHWEITE
jgi:hypothetical protein